MKTDKVKVNEMSRTYNIEFRYRSSSTDKIYDVKIKAIQESDGKISFKTRDGDCCFEFIHSDPDRVIAIAKMMQSFAETMKENYVDTSKKVC